jgi:mevalonate kinase
MARVGGATSKLDGLNEMQRAFASNYAASFNGAQAAIAAGYAKKSAEVQAYRLLRNDKIQAYLRSLRKEVRDKGLYSLEEYIADLKSAADLGRDLGQSATVVRAVEALAKAVGVQGSDKLQVDGQLNHRVEIVVSDQALDVMSKNICAYVFAVSPPEDDEPDMIDVTPEES